MSDSDNKGYHRNTNDDLDHQPNKSDLADFVKKGMTDSQVAAEIQKKYGSDQKMVEKKLDDYRSKMSLIKRKAQKFTHLVLRKYSHLPLPQVLEKAKKYKTKYKFSDEEFDAFVKLAMNDKAFKGNDNPLPNSPMSKALGYSLDMGGKLNAARSNELDVLQEILKIHNDNYPLYASIVIQSLTYDDCAFEALNGRYDSKKDDPYNFIHPVLAALFIPKIKLIDEHMLLASISNILATKNVNKPIQTQPDYELYWDMIADPNEVACFSNRETPFADLRNRVKFQVELWKCVRELRLGRYYPKDAAMNFTLALDNCKNGVYDAPDMTYVRDEGTVLKKIFGAFSLRPTLVRISPMYGTILSGGYQVNDMAMDQITSIPVVNLRLPFGADKAAEVNIKSGLQQPDWFVERGMIVNKVKQIVYSRDMVVFYANRRSQGINFGKLTAPYNFSTLPTTVTGLETLNTMNVRAEPTIEVGNDTFLLRSLIKVEEAAAKAGLITGCSAVITKDNKWKCPIVYDPQYVNPAGGRDPVYRPDSEADLARLVAKNGTIFIYVKMTDEEKTRMATSFGAVPVSGLPSAVDVDALLGGIAGTAAP
jgi:hypothetical protein